MSDEWLVTCPGLAPAARATCTEATPPVAAPMPVSRASNPASRHGVQRAWLARLWQKTWPSKRRARFTVGVGSVISWSTVVTCSAGTPISMTCSFSDASSTRWRMRGGWITQSPAPRTNGGPWSS